MCLLALFGNGLSSSIDNSLRGEKNPISSYNPVNTVHEVRTIGALPNESHVNGYNHDISKIAKSTSYLNANMVNYNLNSGVTTFENFDQNSYSMKGQSETMSLFAEA